MAGGQGLHQVGPLLRAVRPRQHPLHGRLVVEAQQVHARRGARQVACREDLVQLGVGARDAGVGEHQLVDGGEFAGLHLSGPRLGRPLVQVPGRDAGGLLRLGDGVVHQVDRVGAEVGGVLAVPLLLVALVQVVEETVPAAEHPLLLQQLSATLFVLALRGADRVGQRQQHRRAALERLAHLGHGPPGGVHHVGGEDARVADPHLGKTLAAHPVDLVEDTADLVDLAAVELCQALQQGLVAARFGHREGVVDQVEELVLASGTEHFLGQPGEPCEAEGRGVEGRGEERHRPVPQ
ncbi:hypothetical protein L1856_01860 [Streptomyces sp. Tue 6430]|nr:hypothetical protein [Streptomyces sp. Tue 6430]